MISCAVNVCGTIEPLAVIFNDDAANHISTFFLVVLIQIVHKCIVLVHTFRIASRRLGVEQTNAPIAKFDDEVNVESGFLPL